MRDHDFVLTALREANPRVPGSAGSVGEWSPSELLLQVEQRSGTMETIERTAEAKPRRGPGRRRASLAAAVALLVTVIAAAVVIALVGGEDEPDVATPGVESAPAQVETTDTATLDTARRFVVAYADRDLTTTTELLAPGDSIDEPWADIGSVEEYPALFGFTDVLDLDYTLGDCIQTRAGAPAEVVCAYTRRSRLERPLGIAPAAGTFRLVIADGQIQEVSDITALTSGWHNFRTWVSQNHPDDLSRIYTADGRYPVLTPESLALWDRYLYEWAVSVAGPGPISSFDVIAGTAFEPVDPDVDSAFYFFEAGAWHVAYNPLTVKKRPAGVLDTRFEGTRAILTNVSGACSGPSEAIYEIHLLETGNVRLDLIEDNCLFRANFFPGEWRPVLGAERQLEPQSQVLGREGCDPRAVECVEGEEATPEG